MTTITALSMMCASLVAEVPAYSPNSVEIKTQDMQKHNKILVDFSKIMGLSTKEAKIVDGEMRAILLSKKADEKVNLLIALPRFSELRMLYDELASSSGTYTTNASGDITYVLNGTRVSKKKILEYQKNKDNATDKYLEKQNNARAELAKRIEK